MNKTQQHKPICFQFESKTQKQAQKKRLPIKGTFQKNIATYSI